MSLSIEIQKKKTGNESIKITKARDVFYLKEVQEIKDAIQEHFLLIGLDRKNNIRNISLLGVGSSAEINVDSKDILRTALLSASDKVILVHNHPTGEGDPSNKDKNITNIINKFLKIFNIELLDHIIVTENNYTSMAKIDAIDIYYENNSTSIMDNTFLIEENNKLKHQINILTNKLQSYQQETKSEEEELE